MPLGDRQENDLVHITLDVWQDKVYYLGKEYPAGYFAAGVLNASDDLIVNTVREGEFLMNAYQLARIGGREELFELLPMLWDAVKKLLEALREVPPFSLWDMEEELRKMEEMFSRNHLDKLVEDPIEREIFMIYLLGGIMIPMSVYHFVEAVRMFENCYLHRLGRRDETHFAVAFHDFYHAPDTKKLLENSYGRFLEPFEGNSEIKSSCCFARDPKDEKKMIFINRVMFPAYMDFYVYDLLNGMHWGHAPQPVRVLSQILPDHGQSQAQILRWHGPTESPLHLPPVRSHEPTERKERQPPHLPHLQDPDEHHSQTPGAWKNLGGAAERGHRSVRGTAGQGPLRYEIRPGGIPETDGAGGGVCGGQEASGR